MRGTDVMTLIRKGIFASATRYADIGLVAIPHMVQPTRRAIRCSLVHASAQGCAHALGAHRVTTRSAQTAVCEQPDFFCHETHAWFFISKRCPPTFCMSLWNRR
jgi:hypothetical protein